MLVTPQNVNARDTAGRKSSPLHFAAGSCQKSKYITRIRDLARSRLDVYYLIYVGYGRREAVEILLNAGANVHARDDGE